MILGMGSALMDLQITISEEEFAELQKTKEIVKGSMNLLSYEDAQELLKIFPKDKIKKSPGGSVANTIYNLAKKGINTRMFGSIAKDEFGESYMENMKNIGADFICNYTEGSTGTCIILITPDGQRTMFTHLGVAPFFSQKNLNEEIFNGVDYFYIEGYLWDSPDTIETINLATEMAQKKNTKIAFTSSDSFCISRHLEDFKNLAEKVDIFFCNSDELKMIADEDNFESALEKMKNKTKFLVATNGSEGSIIVDQGKQYSFQAEDVKVLDTTGAGDAYASGVFYGLLKNKPMEEVGKVATEFASTVIQKYGGTI